MPPDGRTPRPLVPLASKVPQLPSRNICAVHPTAPCRERGRRMGQMSGGVHPCMPLDARLVLQPSEFDFSFREKQKSHVPLYPNLSQNLQLADSNCMPVALLTTERSSIANIVEYYTTVCYTCKDGLKLQTRRSDLD